MGADLIEAAKLGSAATAHWCSTQNPAITEAILNGIYEEVPSPIVPSTPQVYIAGPFFTVGERWLVETVYNELFSLGVQPWSPVHQVGHGDLEVAHKDIDGLVDSDVVIALLDHADPGTVFEVGFAVSHGTPVVGYAQVLNAEGAKMMAGTEVELHRDLSTACYRAAWVGMGLRPRPGWMTQ
jgi:nucleoside 2-deoxyribosyltransferase